MYRERRHTRHPYLALLLMQLYQQIMQLEYKPPVTIALIVVNVLLFFGGIDILPPRALEAFRGSTLQPRLILEGGQWWRLISSAFIHADEMHLYVNMSSLIWKGVQLEQRYGHWRFTALVSELLLLSHGMYVLVTLMLSQNIPDYMYLYRDVQAVGFSAVLFALKTVLMHNSPGTSEVLGIPLPTKYICWAELFLVSYMVPNASFLGHFCGILAGLLHVGLLEPHLQKWWREVQLFLRRRQNVRTARRVGLGRGRAVGRSSADDTHGARGTAPGAGPASGAGTSYAMGGRDGTDGGGSSSDADSSDSGDGPSGTALAEIRRRRMERFDKQPASSKVGKRPFFGARTAAIRQSLNGPAVQASAGRPFFSCGGALGGSDGNGGRSSGGNGNGNGHESSPVGAAQQQTSTEEELRRLRVERFGGARRC